MIEYSNNAEKLSAEYIGKVFIDQSGNLFINEMKFGGLSSLCFVANEAGSTVKLRAIGTPTTLTIEVSTDGKEWEDYTIGTDITLTNKGDRVYFRNSDVTAFSIDSSNYYNFVMTGSICAIGDITSLLNKDGNVEDLTENTFCFVKLFDGCSALKTAPRLPSLTLGNNCYQYMFNNCTSLTVPPMLPATKLTTSCYANMFTGCTSLVKAPELPAVEMYPNCYFSMFSGCTSLQTAPKLNSVLLSEFCYASMFYGCASLKSAPTLPALRLVSSCYNNMFKNCLSLKHIKAMFLDTPSDSITMSWVDGVAEKGTFVKNKQAKWKNKGTNAIPTNWTIEKV